MQSSVSVFSTRVTVFLCVFLLLVYTEVLPSFSPALVIILSYLLLAESAMSSLLSKFLQPKQNRPFQLLGRIEDTSMSRTMEEYHESNESEAKVSWIWSKAVSVGKKVFAAGVVVTSAPLLIPPFIVASTIAFITSVPYCFFLANYACTQKVMSSLLPSTEEANGGIDNDESGFEHRKLVYGEGNVAMSEPILVQVEDDEISDEEMEKETTSLIDRIRDEDGEKLENAKSGKVQDRPGKQEASETGHEGKRGATATETFAGKDEKTSSNEVYSEEQIWEKMEALRKVVGYSVARSATYAEELKALYAFIGVVEPPRSSLNHDSHDIAHVTVRLRFLMSAIGIN